MTVAFFEVEEWESKPILDFFDDDAILIPDRITFDNIDRAKDCEVISIFIYSSVTKEMLDKLPNLKMIATRSTGYNHIDLDECARRGITVSYVPRYGDVTVAEHVFALLLTIAKHVVDAVDRTRKGDFSFKGLRGFEISGKTLGIVGTGKIGINVAKMGCGFSMRILAYDKFPNEEAAKQHGIEYVPYEQLLRESDFITFHVPELPETHHMLNQENIHLLKKNCIIINTARGGVIETRALVRALSEQKIAGAGLDVLEEEPVIHEERELVSSLFRQAHNLNAILSGQILLRFSNVIITPHSAFNTNEAVRRILDTTLDNIKQFYEGHPANEVPMPQTA